MQLSICYFLFLITELVIYIRSKFKKKANFILKKQKKLIKNIHHIIVIAIQDYLKSFLIQKFQILHLKYFYHGIVLLFQNIEFVLLLILSILYYQIYHDLNLVNLFFLRFIFLPIFSTFSQFNFLHSYYISNSIVFDEEFIIFKIFDLIIYL